MNPEGLLMLLLIIGGLLWLNIYLRVKQFLASRRDRRKATKARGSEERSARKNRKNDWSSRDQPESKRTSINVAASIDRPLGFTE